MPNKTIYISPDNEAYWDRLQNKSGLINDWLAISAGNPDMHTLTTASANYMRSTSAATPKNDIAAAKGLGQAAGYCKHGMSKGFCRYGCKY